MERHIRIVKLSQHETAEVADDTKLRRFRPVRCENCGSEGGFRRCFFEVFGVKDEEAGTDEYQDHMRYHMQREHGLESIFFRCHEGRHFVDTACCVASPTSAA